MRLSFNFGVRHAGSKSELEAFLREQGLPQKEKGTAKENNELADYLVRIADKEVEIQKAVNRMHLLLREERLASETGNPARYDQLLKYSQKAIFGEKGTKQLAAWSARLGEAPGSEAVRQEIDREIQAFALEQIEAKHREQVGYETSLDRLIESAVRLRYYEQRERELEARVAELSQKLLEKDAKIEDLQQALKVAQSEREAIAALRGRISG
jgi:hypothetical protein